MSKIEQPEMIRQKIDAYRKIIEDLLEQIDRIESERNQLTQALHTMQTRLESYESQYKGGEYQAKREAILTPLKMDLSKLSVAEAIKAVLEHAGGPMHVKDIKDAVVNGGKEINSKNIVNVIYATLSKRKKLFEKVGPSFFKLINAETEERKGLFK